MPNFFTKLFGTTIIATGLIPIALANPNGMDMEKMMQQAEAAQKCFQNIDPSQLKALEKQGRQMEQEINALCKAGKTTQATTKALAYSLKVQQDPNFKQIQKCAKYMDGMMPIPKPYMPIKDKESSKSANVCE